MRPYFAEKLRMDKMRLIDSHTHLYFDDYDPSPESAVERALAAGVVHMVLPGVNRESIEPAKRLHALFPECTSVAVGLHPCDVKAETMEEELDIVVRELDGNPGLYCAVGEVGIDKHWDASTIDLQMQAFDRQARKAIELGLPLIIHSRDGLEETLEVLRGLPSVPEAVLHSFGVSAKDAERVLSEFGEMYFGINGIVTFKKATTKEVLPVVPRSQLLLETDAPYLAPVPHRGKRNESAFMVHTAHFVANELGMSVEELGELPTENACRLFGIKL